MNLPKIDISSLPDLDAATGLFGSVAANAVASTDDVIVDVMVLIYEMAAR